MKQNPNTGLNSSMATPVDANPTKITKTRTCARGSTLVHCSDATAEDDHLRRDVVDLQGLIGGPDATGDL